MNNLLSFAIFTSSIEQVFDKFLKVVDNFVFSLDQIDHLFKLFWNFCDFSDICHILILHLSSSFLIRPSGSCTRFEISLCSIYALNEKRSLVSRIVKVTIKIVLIQNYFKIIANRAFSQRWNQTFCQIFLFPSSSDQMRVSFLNLHFPSIINVFFFIKFT